MGSFASVCSFERLSKLYINVREISGGRSALISPIDAAARGIRQHDIIKVFNSRGACLCAAVLSEDIRQGV
ncbi:MAG: hypothetical protein HOI07_07420, partial [Betaproteobacteria bacterium]|nr:hypothetical protein [Betaproteobacteria bacterium]